LSKVSGSRVCRQRSSIYLLFVLLAILVNPRVEAAQVVALGASNTSGAGLGRHGAGVARDQAYPAQLEALLRAQNCNVSVENAGVPGDSTWNLLSRLPGLLGPDTKVLILQPGGNDARAPSGENDTMANIAKIRVIAAQRGVRVIMLENLGRIASGHRLPDGQHFDAEGHALLARYLMPLVKKTSVCGR
jgi:acyl-CoA thioesterase-1